MVYSGFNIHVCIEIVVLIYISLYALMHRCIEIVGLIYIFIPSTNSIVRMRLEVRPKYTPGTCICVSDR
jgi:hypothetical protein